MSTVSVESSNYNSYKDNASGLAINFVGATYFINDYVNLNLGLSYTMANLKDNDDSNYLQKQGNFAGNIIIPLQIRTT